MARELWLCRHPAIYCADLWSAPNTGDQVIATCCGSRRPSIADCVSKETAFDATKTAEHLLSSVNVFQDCNILLGCITPDREGRIAKASGDLAQVNGFLKSSPLSIVFQSKRCFIDFFHESFTARHFVVIDPATQAFGRLVGPTAYQCLQSTSSSTPRRKQTTCYSWSSYAAQPRSISEQGNESSHVLVLGEW